MLNKQACKILKFIKQNGKTTIEQTCNEFPKENNNKNYVSYLIENHYIRGNSKPYYTQNFFTKELSEKSYTVGPYEISEKGLYYLEFNKANCFRFWLPIIIDAAISFIAVIISIIALIY